ncbi:hypothetical protein HYC85_023913, partial [Camellia sinensis]
GTPGLTGSVLWDNGVVLGKFLEHVVESGTILLQGKKVVELGSGCGLVGLRLLRKNVGTNLYGNVHGSAALMLGLNVIYSKDAVMGLLATLLELCGTQTTIILAEELRNAKNTKALFVCILKSIFYAGGNGKTFKRSPFSDRISGFRHHFSIPDDVRLSLVTDGTLDMERADETMIVFPLLSIAEGGVRFPLSPIP